MNIVPKGTGTVASNHPTSTQTFNTGTAHNPNSLKERAIAAFKANTPGHKEEAPKTFAQVRQELESGQKDSNESQLQTQPDGLEQQAEQLEGQEAIQEPQTESVEAEQPKEDPALSSQYAALARREKALRAQAMKQEQAIKSREAALAAREAELAAKGEAKPADYSNYISKDLLKQDALRALADANVSYEELTQQILNQGTMDPRTDSLLRNMEAKIAKLETQLADADKKSQEAKTQDYQAAIKQITSDVKSLVITDPNFEMIKLTGSYKDVVDLIEAKFKQDGTIISNEEAAQQVEDYLVEEAERLARASKIQKRLQPQSSKQATSAPVQQPVQKQQTQPQPMKTLTNANSAQPKLSARERAILAARGELK